MLFINTDKKLMRNKQYDPRLLVLAEINAFEFNEDKGLYFINKRDFNSIIRYALEVDMSEDKRRTRIKVLVEEGLLLEDEDNTKIFYINKVGNNFIKLGDEFADELVRQISNKQFKAFCWLARQYSIGQIKHKGSNYLFSKKNVLECIGYSGVSQKNLNELEETLEMFKEWGIVKYGSPIAKDHCRSGIYYPLNYVEMREFKEEVENQFFTNEVENDFFTNEVEIYLDIEELEKELNKEVDIKEAQNFREFLPSKNGVMIYNLKGSE